MALSTTGASHVALATRHSNRWGTTDPNLPMTNRVTLNLRLPHEEAARLDAMSSLRGRTHAEMEQARVDRIARNPGPTEDEIYLGAFREELEPQVADALFAMNRKGYSTTSSGFGGERAEIQYIEGYFGNALSGTAQEDLRALGIEIERGIDTGVTWSECYATLTFRPAEPDLEMMRAIWNCVADALPDLGHRAPPSITGGAVAFRSQFAPERADVEALAIEYALANEEYEALTETAMRRRLKEIFGKEKVQ